MPLSQLRALAFTVLFCFFATYAFSEETFQLITTGRELTGGESIGIRFTAKMIENPAAPPAENVPVILDPDIPFTFEWTSSLDGTLSFPIAPPQGITLRVLPRPGIQSLAHQPVAVPTNASHLRKTQNYGLATTGRWNSVDDLPANAVSEITFNFNPDPKTLTHGLFYQNETGQTVAASFAPVQKVGYPGRTLSWIESFQPENRDRTTAYIPGRNHFTVSPATPLAPGHKWSLALTKTIRDLDVPSATPFPQTTLHELGSVQDFQIRSATFSRKAHDYVQIRITLNKRLNSSELPKIKLQPKVFNPIEVQDNGWEIPTSTLIFSATPTAGTDLTVTLPKGLLAEDGLPLPKDFKKNFPIPQLPARIYFDDFLTRQISSGNRLFPILGVNVSDANIHIQKVPQTQALNALKSWSQYRDFTGSKSLTPSAFLNGAYWDNDEKHLGQNQINHFVDLHLPSEATILRKKLALHASKNAEETELELNWDDLVGKNKKGMFLVSVEAGTHSNPLNKVGAQTLVELTDIGLVIWTGNRGKEHRNTLHAHSLTTGQPLKNVVCRFFNDKFELLEQTATDNNGITLSTNADTRWVCASLGDDTTSAAVRPFWENRNDENGQPIAETPEPDKVLAYAFSDRGIYRPGETVHLKAFLRVLGTDGIKIQEHQSFTAKIIDGRERVLFEEATTTNKNGSWTKDFHLPNAVGYYRLELSDGKPNGVQFDTVAFRIADFEQDKFAVDILGDDVIAPDKPLNATIAASYLSGQPLNGGKVSWTLHGSPSQFSCPSFESFSFNLPYSPLRQSPSQQGELKLDDDGHVNLSLDVHQNRNAPYPVEYLLETEVTDLNQQTLVASQSVIAHSSDFYLGMRLLNRWAKQNTPIPLAIIAVDTAGKPVSPKAPIELSISRIHSEQKLVDAGGETRTELVETFEILSKQTVNVVTPQTLGENWVVSPSQKSINIKGLPEGTYLLSVASTDGAGRKVETQTRLDIGGATSPGPQNSEDEDEKESGIFTITADRNGDEPLYRVGETAHLLVASEKPGNALLTVQRGSVLRHQPIVLSKERTAVDVPLLVSDIPNVSIHVTRLRGLYQSERKARSPRLDDAALALRVFPKDSQLSVQIRNLPDKVRPGTKLSPTVIVKSADGTPAANAEVTLFAVDEGVLRMSGYKTPDPLESIFATYLPRTERLSNLGLFQREDRDSEYSYRNKGYIVGAGKGEARGQVRGNFQLTPLWIGTAITDSEGRTQADFNAPDNLSEFRVMAVVSHGTTAFGSAASSFKIQKPLQIQPGTTQFARTGDQLHLRAILQNLADSPANVEVTLESDELTQITSDKRIKLTIPAKLSSPVDFDATFIKQGKTRLEWTVQSSNQEDHDSVETFLNIAPATPLITETHVLKTPSGLRDLAPLFSAPMLTGESSLTASVFYSPVSQLHTVARSLLHYPYGCAEQTVSTTLPWILIDRLHLPEARVDKSDEMIRSALDRLDNMRAERGTGGGIGYWPGATVTMPFATAYTGVLLGILKEYRPAQFDQLVPSSLLSTVKTYLKKWLQKPTTPELTGDLTGQTMAAYALASLGEPEAGAEERLIGLADLLSADERTLLSLALLSRPENAPVAQRILTMQGGRPGSHFFSSQIRDRALLLMAWRKLDPNNQETTRLLAELLGSQNAGEWGNTHANAWALLSILSALPTDAPLTDSLKGNLQINSETLSFNLTADRDSATLIAPIQKQGAPASLSFENACNHPLFLQVALSRYEENRSAPALRQGYSLTRSFTKLDAQNHPLPNSPLNPGDSVLIKLEITAHQDGQFLAITCPLPAILEPIQNFGTRQTTASRDADKNNFSDYTEIHGDHLVFFRNLLRKGSYTIEALARVRCAGEAIAPGARIEEMYRPEHFGQTPPQQISAVKP